MPRSIAAASSGRSRSAGMMRCTEPTSWARSHAVHGVELGGDLAELLGAHGVADSPPARPAGWRRDCRSSARTRSSRCGALVDVAGEHHGGRRGPADHRGERALDGEHLHVVVERRREHDERPAVVAGHDAQHDRAVEVDDRPADLGAVLELQAAQRLRRAVEAGQVGQHDDRPAPARRVDRPRHLLRRQREQRAGRPLRRPVGRRRAVARQRPRLDADHRHGVAAEAGVVHDGRLGLGHLRPPLERLAVAVDDGADQRADVERLLAVGVGAGREDVADRS